jgi:hypothetical protein
MVHERIRELQRAMQQDDAFHAAQAPDLLQDARFRLDAESRQLAQPPFQACGLEPFEVAHAQRLLERADPLQVERTHASQLERAGRHLGSELVEERRTPRGRDFGDHPRKAGPDAGNRLQRAGGEPPGQVARETFDGRGAALVGAHAEGALALQAKALRDLAQRADDGETHVRGLHGTPREDGQSGQSAPGIPLFASSQP